MLTVNPLDSGDIFIILQEMDAIIAPEMVVGSSRFSPDL